MGTVRALVLAGGLGSRLRSVVSDLPKALAPVGGRPFLEYLLRQLSDQGIQDVTICTGYGSNAIQRYVDDLALPSVRITVSDEPQPLGTGGALRLAMERHPDGAFLVLNGNSFFDVRFDRLIDTHRATHADVTLAVRFTSNPGRFGSVSVDEQGWVTSFREKVDQGPGLINGGIYMIDRAVLANLPDGQAISLEQDVFPRLVDRTLGRRGIATAVFDGWFTDIGVPADYRSVDDDPRPIVAALARASRC